jgi:hypothetical protein
MLLCDFLSSFFLTQVFIFDNFLIFNKYCLNSICLFETGENTCHTNAADTVEESLAKSMIEKKDLLHSVQALLDVEEELLCLCRRQAGSITFFSGLPLQSRPDVRAGLEAFCARSQQHRLALQNLMESILSGGQDVY